MKKLRMFMAMFGVMALVLGLAGTAGAGVVHYWQFDDNKVDALDVRGSLDLPYIGGSRSALYATIANPDTGPFDDNTPPVSNANSVHNPQFRLNNTSDFRMVGQSWTLEGYFYRNTVEFPLTTSFGEIIANTRNGTRNWDDGWTLLMNPNGEITIRAEDGNTAISHATSSGENNGYADATWHHFAITWDHDNGANGYMQIYIDGIREAHGEGVGTGVDAATVDFTVGYRVLVRSGEEVDNNMFKGRFDEFRWTYDEVLTPNQFLNYVSTATDAPIPEPASLGLLGLALLGLRKRRS